MRGRIQVEITVKAPSRPEVVTAANVHEAKPRPEDIERCRRWVAARGLDAFATDFTVVCEGTPEQIADLFGDAEQPVAPLEIAEFVDQVTVPRPPDLF